MMLPEPRSAMPRPKSRIRRKVPLRFNSTTLSNSSSVISSTGFLTLTLGVLTSTSGVPTYSTAFRTLSEVRHVQLDGLCVSPVRTYLRGRIVRGLFVHVRAHDAGSEGGEAMGAGLTDAAAGPDDERGLVCQVEHRAVVKHGLPLRRRSTCAVAA